MADSSSYHGFPKKNLPESQKDEKWHKDFVLSIMHETLSGGWASLTSWSINDNYNKYQSMDSGKDTEFIQSAEDGKELPAIWIDYNSIRSKVKVMIGELIKKGFNIQVESINSEARTKKMEIKNQLLARMTTSRLHNEVMEEAGIPIGELIDFEASGFIPNSEAELETFMKSKYKDNMEIIMEAALRYNVEYYKWKMKRIHAFRDVMIAGRCFGVNEIRNGYPQPRILDPRRVVFDPHATDDFLTDASYWGHIRYISYEDAIEQYGLTETEIEELGERNKTGNDLNGWGGAAVGVGQETFTPFLNMDGNGGTRIMVFEAEWYDRKEVKYTITEDQYGNEHLHMLEEGTKYSKKDNIKTKYIINVRRGALVGGYIMKEWGEAKNLPRSIDNPAVTRLSLVALLPDYLNFRTVSKVDELGGLQKLKNILMYKIQLEINTAGKKSFFYDVSLLPEGFELEDVMYYLKSSGIGVYDSRKEGLPIAGAPVVNVDGSLGNNIGQYLDVAMFVEKQMEVVTGINEARQGAAAASALVGVTEANLFQSNMTTEQYYELFREWESRMFQAQADLIKVTWAQQRDKFAPIIGDLGIDFLTLDQDVDLTDYAIFAKSMPLILEDKQMLHNLTQMALQAGAIDFSDALTLLTENDSKIGIRKFHAIQDRKAQMMADQQQQQSMVEQGNEAAAQESKLAEIDAKEGHVTAREVRTEGMKTDREVQRAKIKAASGERQLEAGILKQAMVNEKS